VGSCEGKTQQGGSCHQVKSPRRCALSRHRRVPPLTRVRRRAHQPLDGVWHLERSVRQRSAVCPRGRHRSRAGHRFSQRPVAALPRAGVKRLLPLQVRRVFCRHGGFAVGGRAGARLRHALGVPGSSRPILRLSHRAPWPTLATPRVMGLDEGAWRRGRRLGTMVGELARPQGVDLLPERTASAGAPWLQAHPGVELVGRERRGRYAEGRRPGAPPAVQVVARFPLGQPRREALERLFLRSRRDLKTLDRSGHRPAAFRPTLATISPARHARWVRRSHQSPRWHAPAGGMAAIARQLQGRRPPVSRDLARPQPPERHRSRHRGQPRVAPFTPSRRRRWKAGGRNAQPRWRA
jgi:hypothetical protein